MVAMFVQGPPATTERLGRNARPVGDFSCAESLADRAVAALVAEAELTPKPGLVDRRGAGAHADMELHTLLTSANALRPTFRAIARAAEGATASQRLREKLSSIGRDGEAAMFGVTGGVNTHRGAIWALGLIVAAASMVGSAAGAEAICRTAGTIACFSDRFASDIELKGTQACRVYGVSGARGEAAAGFPNARLALDTLRRARAAGRSETASQIDALLIVMSRLEDTCLLHRGGMKAARVARLGPAPRSRREAPVPTPA